MKGGRRGAVSGTSGRKRREKGSRGEEEKEKKKKKKTSRGRERGRVGTRGGEYVGIFAGAEVYRVARENTGG